MSLVCTCLRVTDDYIFRTYEFSLLSIGNKYGMIYGVIGRSSIKRIEYYSFPFPIAQLLYQVV